MWCAFLLTAVLAAAGNIHPHNEREILDLQGTITKVDAVNRAVELDAVDPRTKQVRNLLLVLDKKVKLRNGKAKVELASFKPGQRVNCTVERTYDDADVERLVALSIQMTTVQTPAAKLSPR
jgi:hypothetical protein